MALDDPQGYEPWSWVPQNWLQPAPDPAAPIAPPVPAPAPVEMATPTLPPPPEQMAPVPPPELPAQEAPPPPPTFEPLAPETWGAQPEMPLAPVGHMRTEAAPGEQSLSVEERQRLNATDPAAYAKLQIDEAEDDAAKARAGMSRLAHAEAEEAEASLRVFNESQAKSRQMMQQVEADVTALANEKPKKFTDSLGNVIGSIIGVALGAFGQSASGGRNMGVEGMNAAMDRFTNEQTAEYNRKAGNVDRRMNLIAKLRDAGYNDYQSREVIRLAGYERAKQMMLTDIQDYDPQGTTARNKMRQYEAFDAAQKQAAEKFRQQQLDESIKVGEYNLKVQKANDEHAAAQRKLGMGGAGAGGSVKPGNLTGAEVTDMLRKAGFNDVAPVLDKPGGYTPNEAKQRVELGGKVVEEERKTRGRFVEGITTASGEPFEFASDDEGKKFRVKKAAVEDLNALIGDVVRDLDEHGGTFGPANSSLNKKYQSRLATIDMKLKNAFETGSLDEGAMKVMGKLKGGDVTSMITGGTEGLDTLRDDLVRSINMEIGAQPGYDGPGFQPTYSPRLPKADGGPGGARLQQTIKASYLPAATLDKVRTGKAGPELPLDPLGSKENVDVHLEQLEKAARVNDDDGRDAKRTLQSIADKAVNADVKKRAAEILKTIPKPRMSGPVGGDGGSR